MWRVGNTPPAGRQSSFPVVASDPWAVVSEEDEEIDPPMAQISFAILCVLGGRIKCDYGDESNIQKP
jgi:hypothetical protein